jgi:hypothetical protein
MYPRRPRSFKRLIEIPVMFARQVPRAVPIAEAADHTSGALIERRTPGRFVGQAFFDITSDHLGERQTTLACLGTESPLLLFRQLNLCPNHDLTVITS